MSDATRILIVGDEPTYREYLERFLSRDGLDVRTAETGAEAIELAKSFAPDILLADWMLRCEMHGIEVGEALRAQRPDLRILLMTGFPTADLEAEGLPESPGLVDRVDGNADVGNLVGNFSAALYQLFATRLSHRIDE